MTLKHLQLNSKKQKYHKITDKCTVNFFSLLDILQCQTAMLLKTNYTLYWHNTLNISNKQEFCDQRALPMFLISFMTSVFCEKIASRPVPCKQQGILHFGIEGINKNAVFLIKAVLESGLKNILQNTHRQQIQCQSWYGLPLFAASKVYFVVSTANFF